MTTIPPKTLVVGATGFLGRHCLVAVRAHHPDCIGTSRDGRAGLAPVDLARPDVSRLALEGYSHAIVAAAATQFARCEADREGTRAQNVTGTLSLARQLAARGITTVFFSSDSVFDGRTGHYDEAATPHALHEYGRQKLEVEERLGEATGGNCLVARLAKLLGTTRGDGTMLDEMADRLTRGEVVRAAWDQVMTPTHVEDVVAAVLALEAAGARGLVHVVGPEVWSRWELARTMGEALGIEGVERISLDDLGESFARPKHTDMVAGKLAGLVDVSFRTIRSCIGAVARQYRPA